MKNILHITNELNTVDGVTNHIHILLKSLANSYNGKIFLLAGGGNNTGILEGTGVSVSVNPVINHKNRNIGNFLSAIKFVRKFVKENNIGLIHSHNHYAANIARYVSTFTRVVTVQTNHGLFPDTGRLKLFNADYHIALNNRVAAHMKEKGIPVNRIRIMKSGIVCDYPGIKKEKNTFLAASRFTKDKGLDKYIIASNKIAGKYPGKFRFYITGEGDEEKNLKQLNNKTGGAVEFLNDYKGLLSSSQIFVFTTEASEGLPTVLLEALFCGCLAVSSAYDGITDLFPEPYTELLFRQGDVNALQNKMVYAAGNYDTLINRYRKLYETTKKEYSPERMTDEHLRLYRKITL